MTLRFVFQVEGLDLRQRPAVALLCSRTALETVQHCEELLLFVEAERQRFGLSSILECFGAFREFCDEVGVFHAFFFVFFILESFEVECFVEVFDSDFVPAFIGVNVFDSFEIVYLYLCFLFEELAELVVVHFHVVFHLFFLCFVTVFVQQLHKTHFDHFCDQLVSLFLGFGRLVCDFLEERVSST